MAFSTLSLIIASLVKKRERFMGTSRVLTTASLARKNEILR
jgi:hypothetical protein